MDASGSFALPAAVHLMTIATWYNWRRMLGEEMHWALAAAVWPLFLWWFIILPMAFGPALVIGAVRGCWRVGFGVWHGLLVGVGVGIAGVFIMLGWTWASMLAQSGTIFWGGYPLVAMFIAALTWKVCAVWDRRRAGRNVGRALSQNAAERPMNQLPVP